MDPDDQDGDPYEDWAEIYNAGLEDVDLGGMYMADSHLELHMIPTGDPATIVPAGGFIIVYFDDEPEDGPLHIPEKLGDGGDEIYLYNVDGVTLLDSYIYDEQTTDVSMGRLPDGSSFWTFFEVPTPGATNGELPPVELYINEFIASNDTGLIDPDDQNDDPYEDWVEIYNPGFYDVDLGGMFMADSHQELHMIPMGDPATIIPAGGYIITFFDDEPEDGPLHIPEKLGGGGDEIWLFDVDGATVIDSYFYDAQTTDVSEGRFPDGSDTWEFFAVPTPGSANVQTCLADGDANMDASTDILDIVMIVGYILGTVEFTEDNFCHSDSNGDGNIDILDVVTIVDQILNGPARIDNATYGRVDYNNTGAALNADGFVGAVQMTLSHHSDFSLNLTDNALLAEYVTDGNSTTLIIVAPEGTQLFTSEGEYEITSVVAASGDDYIAIEIAGEYSLLTNYPNPFNPSTTINYSVVEAGHVNISVYDINGREVAELVSGFQSAGYHSMEWNASAQSSGIYFVKMTANGLNQTLKLALMK